MARREPSSSDESHIGARSDREVVAQMVEHALTGELSHHALRVLTVAIRESAWCRDREGLSRAVGVARRTLHRHLDRAGLCSPRYVLAWAELLVACRYHEAGLTLEQVAVRTRRDGSAAIVHLFRSYAGTTPGQLRLQGGPPAAVEILRTQIRTRTRSCGDAPGRESQDAGVTLRLERNASVGGL